MGPDFELHQARIRRKRLDDILPNFERINVIMGANGSGKSRLLRDFASHRESLFPELKKTVYIEGGRAISVPHPAAPVPLPDWVSKDAEIEQLPYQFAITETLSNKLIRAFGLFGAKEQDQKRWYIDKLEAWKEGPRPLKPRSPFERLCLMFNKVLPELTLVPSGRFLGVRKGSIPYAVSDLSDGEKQILALLVDIEMFDTSKALFLIDEPELNLHPSLADRFWSTIDENRPDSVFIYATHSIGFAMRPGVDVCLVISSDGKSHHLCNPSTLEPTELRPFLGAIPGILRSGRAFLVEGTIGSIDKSFYPWVLDDETLEVVPLGGCAEVMSATKGMGLWEKLATKFQLIGVVDRDFRSDDELTKLRAGGCKVTHYHEAESYFCHPDLLAKLAQELRPKEKTPTKEDITKLLVEFCQRELIGTSIRRFNRRIRPLLEFSPKAKEFETAGGDADKVVDMMKSQAKEHAEKINASTFADEAGAQVREEFVRIKNAIDARDIDQLLQLFPAKSIANHLAKAIKLSGREQLAAFAIGLLEAKDFPHIEPLRRLLGFQPNKVEDASSDFHS